MLLQGAQMGAAGGWAPWLPHFNHCLCSRWGGSCWIFVTAVGLKKLQWSP